MASTALEHVRPTGRQIRHARPKGSKVTICMIDSARWAGEVVEAEPLTCDWCRLRAAHGIEAPTPLDKLPKAAIAEAKRIAKRRGAK